MSFLDTESIRTAASAPYAIALLSLLSLSESAFFIIPPEVLLIPMALANPQQALWLGLLTSVISVAGALFGYWIGQKGGKPLLNKLFKKESIEKVKILYHKYDAWTILIAAFTPIPFKLATISAGVFDINRKRFVIASATGRTTRYMIIAGLLYVLGEPIKAFIEEDLNRFLAIATLIAIAAFAFLKYVRPYIERKVLENSLKNRILAVFKRKITH